MAIAKVGDYVRITKVPDIKGYEETLQIGDVGKVTYLANTTMKYSVHIEGKKNPADIAHPNSRAYGEKYDFWIPPDCCEIVERNLLGYCNDLGNTLTLKDNTIYINDMDITTLASVAVDATVSQYSNIWDKNLIKADGIVNMNFKESEETKMKEIKNQKVVDLYFERKVKELKLKTEAAVEEQISFDPHQSFISELKRQFEEYVNVNESELKRNVEVKFNVYLPLTEACSETVQKIREQGLDEVEKVHTEKAEVLAMLSGCETYEQEMAILRSYGIVGEDNKLVQD